MINILPETPILAKLCMYIAAFAFYSSFSTGIVWLAWGRKIKGDLNAQLSSSFFCVTVVPVGIAMLLATLYGAYHWALLLFGALSNG